MTDLTDETDAGIGIDELARRSGMTVRNVRAHQSRGLLPPPEVRGRTGYYDADHVARLELIKELQADGYSLEVIARLLTNARGSSPDVLRFTRTLRAPFEQEEPEVVTAAELVLAGPAPADPKLLVRAIRVGLVRDLGDGRYELRSPRLQTIGADLVALGIPAERSLDVAERLRRHSDGVARVFTKLFLDTVWQPFERAGSPPEQWPEVLDALERLRPLAAEALVAMFGLAMTDAVEKEFGRTLERGGRR